jgi:hypothetical protein
LSAHQQEAALLDREPIRPELLTGEPGRMEGRRIDHYEILRELGRGGMGSVYLAVRTDDVYRKPVAFKVVRPEAGTPEVIQRFRREREILASLDHPNLARLLDGGTTPEGLPYFVMDYVEGQPIDTYCDERQLNVAERLKLFRSVSAAVLSAGLAAGFVKLNFPATLILGGLLTIVPGGYCVIRKQYGHETASRTMSRVAGIMVVFLALWMGITWLAGRYELLVVSLAIGITDVLLGSSLARWPFRERWAGPLLLDLTSRKDRMTVYTWASVSAALAVLMAAWDIRGPHSHKLAEVQLVVFGWLMLGLFIGCAFVCAGRIELRQRGAIVSGIWLPWSSIESYSWQDTGGEFVVLKVRSRKWLLVAFGSALEVVLPMAQKSPTDTILKRQLAEWPGS